MEILWGSGGRELSVRNVADQLPEYAYTTVATVLDRLVRKELLQRRMDGRTIRFVSVGSKGAHTAVQMHTLMAEDGDPEAVLRCFAANLSDTEVAILRRSLGRGGRASEIRSA